MDELAALDAATVAHIRGNVEAYRRQLAEMKPESAAWASTWAGILAGNVDSLLGVIERLARPQSCLQSWTGPEGAAHRCQLGGGHDGLHQHGQAYATPSYVGRHREAGA